MKSNVTVIGAGSWGTALSILLSKNGHNVKMWTHSNEEADMINRLREHVYKLPGVIVPDGVVCTSDMEEALHKSEMVAVVLPSQTIRENAGNISRYVEEGTPVVCCSKGLEESTCNLLSEVIKQEIPQSRVVVLSGPSHAEEVARDIPTAVVASSESKEAAEMVQDVFMSPKFRVYTNPDTIGVQLGGAVKNVIALCAGISDGLGFGDNTKAALMTRGITEITRLGAALGARPETFGGLTGIGDLIVTCTSMHSRNRRAGILIGQGKSVKEAIEEVKMVVEGVTTTKAAYKLSMEKDVEMPITTEAYEVLFNGKNPQIAVADLMMRDRKHEMAEDVSGNCWQF
jgi:glycerol-3-phosphate dehydrogenase (NAD(P)+)